MQGADGSGVSPFLCWHILAKDLEPPSPSKCCLCSQEVPLAAGSCSCPILVAFQAHLGEGSEQAELWVQPGPQRVAADQIFPGKPSGDTTARSFALDCTSTCVLRARGTASMSAKVGIEEKERLRGSRKREQEKGDKAQGPFRRNCDTKIRSKTTQLYPGCLGMNKTRGHEGIAHHLPPASGICPGLSKSTGKP